MKSKFRTYKQTELLPNMLKESEVQKQVMQYLVLCGYLVVRINSGAFVDGKRFIRAYRIENNGKSNGFPDVLALKQGKCMLFEIKAGNGGKLSQNQKDFIELARQKGIDVHIISDLQQAIQITEKG